MYVDHEVVGVGEIVGLLSRSETDLTPVRRHKIQPLGNNRHLRCLMFPRRHY